MITSTNNNIMTLILTAAGMAASTGCALDDRDPVAGAIAIGEASAELEVSCFNSEYYCELDLAAAGGPTLSCPNLPSNDVQIVSTQNGVVVEVDMASWSQVQVEASITPVTDYAFHIANSTTNNGWGGDSGTTTYDSEAHLYGNGLYVYRNDHGLAAAQPHLAASLAKPIPKANGRFCATVGNGELSWYGWLAGAAQSSTYLGVSDPYIFQLGGAGNDQLIHLGFDRMVGAPSRTGSDIYGTVLISLMP